MTAVAGELAEGGAAPQRLQWSQAWLGFDVGTAGAGSDVSATFPPLWQMTENGSTAAAAA